MFSVRVPDDLASRFDGVAAGFGGRSARLRQLIEGACAVAGPQVKAAPEPRTAMRMMVRLAAPEARHVATESARLALPRAAWVAALVRRHARGVPTFSRPDELAVIAIQSELRRIGVNVNQIARALNTAVMEGRVLEAELGEVAAFRRELRDHLLAVREAFQGNLTYWDVMG
ncbi:plasmid mobilization relaxosome protein MobC [Phenylobacterium sp.]|jgi:metal-responsive CopG/Arc/MetJ family transcriptional regulator|uniref:plasmid mobilization relaxosome protein MobC n=1 Tax=Phenylobacterium sp. TaxID=1871053 RepID=UPI002F3FF5FF